MQSMTFIRMTIYFVTMRAFLSQSQSLAQFHLCASFQYGTFFEIDCNANDRHCCDSFRATSPTTTAGVEQQPLVAPISSSPSTNDGVIAYILFWTWTSLVFLTVGIPLGNNDQHILWNHRGISGQWLEVQPMDNIYLLEMLVASLALKHFFFQCWQAATYLCAQSQECLLWVTHSILTWSLPQFASLKGCLCTASVQSGCKCSVQELATYSPVCSSRDLAGVW